VQMVNPGASGADAEKQAWLAKYATGPSAEPSAPGVLSVQQISAILRDQFGILPKRKTIGYSKPYPSDYDLIPLPPKYRLPEFTKFSGSEEASSIEHVSRYLTQLGMILVSDPLRVRFFSQSLTGSALDGTRLCPQIRSGPGGSWRISSTPNIIQRLLKPGLLTSPKLGRSEEKVCQSTSSASEKLRIDATHRASQKRRQLIWLSWGSLSRSRIWLFSWNSPRWHTWCRSLRRMNTITLSCTRKNSSDMSIWPKQVIPMILARNKKWLWQSGPGGQTPSRASGSNRRGLWMALILTWPRQSRYSTYCSRKSS